VSALPAKKAPTYRAFESTDIIAAHALSLAVGWPHRAEDWQSMFAAGSGFVAQDDGEVIGTALYWKCGTDRGTLGLVIVSPEAQGRGIGRQLMELVLEALGNRVTFLHATPAGKPLYERLGFEACGTVDQHQGVVSRVRSVTPPAGEQLRSLKCDDVPQVVELASRACAECHAPGRRAIAFAEMRRRTTGRRTRITCERAGSQPDHPCTARCCAGCPARTRR